MNELMAQLLGVLVRRNGGLKTISQGELDAASKGMVVVVPEKAKGVLTLRFFEDRTDPECLAALAVLQALTSDTTATEPTPAADPEAAAAA